MFLTVFFLLLFASVAQFSDFQRSGYFGLPNTLNVFVVQSDQLEIIIARRRGVCFCISTPVVISGAGAVTDVH